MAKGILKVVKTNKGKIFVELDRLNGKPPMPLSYVVFPDTTLSGKECDYTVDAKGIFVNIKVEGKEVWSRTPVHTGLVQNTNDPDSKFQDSLSFPHTFLPKDVRAIGLTDIDNFALKLQKAARYEANLNKDVYKFTLYKNDTRDRVHFEIKANYGHTDFESLCKRQEQHVESLYPNKSRPIKLQPKWRMILGIGGESVYETNMTLHHNYGIPYLPSSSIKGVLRSWIITQVFAKLENAPHDEQNHPLINAEYRAITSSKLFCTIFGCPKESKRVVFRNNEPLKNKDGDYIYDENATLNVFKKEVKYQDVSPTGEIQNKTKIVSKELQGSITFFDGIPNVAPKIKTDVMNVHYKDWYKDIGYQAPTDTQRTNPIHFLTVSNENKLQFHTHIAAKNNPQIKEIEWYEIFIKDTSLTTDSSVLDLVDYWLKNALSFNGIGAKTAVGYGYMQETK
jgi:CRISPR-associated protein Cmr6